MSDTVAVPQSRIKATRWAREIVANPDVVFLDTEALGKEHTSEICDIGIVGIDGTVLVDHLVRPSVPIPAEATAIHGISNDMVAEAQSWEALWPVVGPIIRRSKVVIYNSGYDIPILNNANKRIGTTEGGELQGDCAMLAFADWMATPGKYGSFKWHRLDVAAAEFGIPPGGHRALADAETCRRVVLAMAAHESGELTETTSQASLFPLPNPDRFR